jgi:putative ABC transport system substrate-binding protein
MVSGAPFLCTNYHDLFRRIATFVDEILKGINPGELPVEQPTTFELLINLRTAKVICLKSPIRFCCAPTM